jgi:hypothetical protein
MDCLLARPEQALNFRPIVRHKIALLCDSIRLLFASTRHKLQLRSYEK